MEEDFIKREDEYERKFGTSSFAPDAICKDCGVIQAKHFGYVCPTKEQLKHIQTPQEELEQSRTSRIGTNPHKLPLTLKAFFYILIKDHLPISVFESIIEEAHNSNYALFINKEVEALVEDKIRLLLEE